MITWMTTWIGGLTYDSLFVKSLPGSSLRLHRSLSASTLFDGIPHRDAAKLFASSAERNPDSLNSTVIGLARDGHFREALELFRCVNGLGLKPTKFTLCSVLTSCSKAPDVIMGLQVHARIVKMGYEGNIFLNSKLVDLYAKSGVTADARRVFNGMREHDQVSWTSIISGLSQNGCEREALILLREMLDMGVRPNCFTFASVISACTKLEIASQHGKLLHAHVIKSGFEPNTFVISSLIDFYAKQGEIDQSMLLFDATTGKDSILYNSMIVGYSQNMLGEEALKLFVEMQERSIDSTDFTFSSLLNACASLTVLSLGKQMHSLVCKVSSDKNVFVVSSLVDMYSKCGYVDEARRAFDCATKRNSILWTSMITGYAQNGRGVEGLKLFDLLLKEGGKPDHICFTGLLTACNHAGFLDEGIHYFNLMTCEFGLVPELDQYACMVDLYGRTGHLRKAKEIMHTMPFEPNAVMWSSFLGSCRVYGEIELGKEAAIQLFKLEPGSAAPYVTLANTYAEVGMWNEVTEVRQMMKFRRVRKTAGWSWVEVDKRVHVFSVSDGSHPQSQDIYVELDKITLEMRHAGYVPMLKYVLQDVGFLKSDMSNEHQWDSHDKFTNFQVED